MFYRGADIHHLFVSDQTRVGDVTHIPCNAVPPDRGCWVHLTLKPDTSIIFDILPKIAVTKSGLTTDIQHIVSRV
jgi:hypothetical protein